MSDGSMCSFSAGQELLASSNLNIHKSGEKTLGSAPKFMKHNVMQPIAARPQNETSEGLLTLFTFTFTFSFSLSVFAKTVSYSLLLCDVDQ